MQLALELRQVVRLDHHGPIAGDGTDAVVDLFSGPFDPFLAFVVEGAVLLVLLEMNLMRKKYNLLNRFLSG